MSKIKLKKLNKFRKIHKPRTITMEYIENFSKPFTDYFNSWLSLAEKSVDAQQPSVN